MKIILTLFLTGGFCFPSMAQYFTEYRPSFNSETGQIEIQSSMHLNIEKYPWYVCLEGIHLTSKEKEWTRQAIQRWNNAYTDYKIKRWGSADVLNIPKRLFAESCDYSDHGIIYIKKLYLPDNVFGRQKHSGGWFRPVQSLIEIDIRDWEPEMFINVKMHELGHTLGLPHPLTGTSEVMDSHVCQTGGKVKICSFLDYDFEVFLSPYNPEKAITRAQKKLQSESFVPSATENVDQLLQEASQ